MTLVNKALPFELPDFESLGAGKGYDSITYHLTRTLHKTLKCVRTTS